jgi:hypothetical protein
VVERYLAGVRLSAQGVMTHLGILHGAGHPEPWIIATDCAPTRATVLDYAARRAIEPMFSDFKGRGFELEDSQLGHADRPERLLPVMSLAINGRVRVGQEDAPHRPTPLGKKRKRKATRAIGYSGNSTAARCPGSRGVCAA